MIETSRPGRAGLVVLICMMGSLWGGCRKGPELTLIAQFGKRQCTGVGIAHDGRVFVNFPRWSQTHGESLVEVLPDGTTRPFPNEQWNRWNESESPKERFVCVQSLWIDTSKPSAALWVLDSGNPRFEGVVANAPKLVQIDLTAGRVVRIIRLDSTVALKDSYLNDVRVDEKRGFAYITDSGLGGIIVVDLNINRSRRILDDHPAGRAEAGLAPVIGGTPWSQDDGSVPQIHADGIALTGDGEHLYFKALTGKTLYRIPTVGLRNFSLPDSHIANAVESLGETLISDGMIVDRKGNLYLTALEQNAVIRRSPDGKMETVVADERLRWCDSLAISPEDDLYITVSQIHLTARFNKGEDLRTEPCSLYKLPLKPRPLKLKLLIPLGPGGTPDRS